MATGETPFTLKQVKRLRILGTSFLVFELVETLMSTFFFFHTEFAGQDFGVIMGNAVSGSFIQVNPAAILAAFACFGLAIMFKYGILLQELSDDTL